MAKNLDTLYDLCETLSEELDEANAKIRKAGGKLSAGDLDYIDKLTHSLKSVKTTIAMAEAEDKGYSGFYWDGRYYRDGEPEMDGMSNREGGMSGARGRGSNAKRDSRGRYSSRTGGGYSRAEAKEDFIEEVEELLEKAPDEHTRKKFERFIAEMR